MSLAQRLRALAKRTALDGIAEELVAIAAELDQRPAAQEVDDGDVTGQPGPLPETGWDEVPESAFRKPSPTAGMNLGERIRHVGGRENAAGYIEFGSVAAVRALVRQYLRDLPAPQQATPTSGNILTDAFNEVQALKQQATPDWLHLKPYGYAPGGYMSKCLRCGQTPAGGLDKRATSCRPCAEAAYAPQQATRATREAEQRARMQARIAARPEGKASADFDLPAPNDAIQQATPEPVGERWVVVRETSLDVGDGNDVRTGGRPELGYALISDAATFGSEGEAVAAIESANLPVGWVVLPLSRLLPDLEYTRPAPGVPEDAQRDAARWEEVLRQVGADRQCGGFRFTLYNLRPIPGSNPMQGAVCQHFTQAVDAALAAAQAKQ